MKHTKQDVCYSVNKYNPLTSPLCTFCEIVPERISHIFFECQRIQELYRHIEHFLEIAMWQMRILKRYCIFGYDHLKGYAKENLLLGLCRSFIWKQKAQKSPPTFTSWKAYLKWQLELRKACIKPGNMIEEIKFEDDWGTFLLQL